MPSIAMYVAMGGREPGRLPGRLPRCSEACGTRGRNVAGAAVSAAVVGVRRCRIKKDYFGASVEAEKGRTMWGYHWGVGWGWMLLGMAFMVVFWGALIWLFASLIRGASGRDPHEGPREIADRRLAAGEISEEEHDRIVAKLSG